MAKPDPAIDLVLLDEGSRFTDRADDRGGPTKFGISKKGFPAMTREAIKNLTREDAVAIYLTLWNRGTFARVKDQTVATKWFNIRIVQGYAQAARNLQRACRSAGFPVVADGWPGDKTIGAANAAKPGEILAAFRSETAGIMRQIVAMDRSQKGNLKGWENRSYR